MTKEIIDKQRRFFKSGRTLPPSFRVGQLRGLRGEILKRRFDIEDALEADLKRSHFETFLAETLLILAGLKNAIKNTAKWSLPKSVCPSILNFYSSDKVRPGPYGLSLIISPCNYPFLLSMTPLTAAISAGNCAIIKPSELAPCSSAVLAEIVKAAFPEEYVTVVQGGADMGQDLLSQKFDKIFFTGSAQVGKLVLKAAAEHLIPVTLELGGKSPCIVTGSADLAVAAKRIIWGKLLNAGQTCLAPDYLLVHRSKEKELLGRLIETIGLFYGQDIRRNSDYPRIINEKNFNRLTSLLDPAKIFWGGENDLSELYLGPAIMSGVTWADRVMEEEIFGPILPVLSYNSLEEVINIINEQGKPLALYLFTKDRREVKAVWARCGFGGGCVNDVLSHVVNERLPFGGVDSSGMGSYHGKWGFQAFSHYKSLLKRAVHPDLPLRYPPHSRKDTIKKIMTILFKS